MLLIPGILASKFVPQGDFESIATVVVGSGGQSTITFNSIPGTYQHLQIRYLSRNDTAAYFVRFQFNGVTSTASYVSHLLQGSGSAAASAAEVGTNSGILAPRSSTTANIFTGGIVDILDYANTNKNKTVRSLGGVDLNGSGQVEFMSGAFLSTNAITSITAGAIGGNFTQHSHFALYGIKG